MSGIRPEVCEHGNVKRKCQICEDAEDIAQLERRCAELEALIWEFAERRGDFIESDETHWVKLRETLDRRIAEARGK
jgi:hypothetical protein